MQTVPQKGQTWWAFIHGLLSPLSQGLPQGAKSPYFQVCTCASADPFHSVPGMVLEKPQGRELETSGVMEVGCCQVTPA